MQVIPQTVQSLAPRATTLKVIQIIELLKLIKDLLDSDLLGRHNGIIRGLVAHAQV